MRGSTRSRSGRRAGVDAGSRLEGAAGRASDARTGPTRVGGLVPSEFLDGAEVSCDGGSDLLARFAGIAMRTGRAVALSFAVVAGGAFAGVDVSISSEASAAEWSGPSRTFWDIVRVKLRKVGGADFEDAFLHEVDVFQAACATSPGVGCRFEMAGVVLDFGADRYVVVDPDAVEPLEAVQEDGVLRIVDGSTGRALDSGSEDAAWRITRWIMDETGEPPPGMEATLRPAAPSPRTSFR